MLSFNEVHMPGRVTVADALSQTTLYHCCSLGWHDSCTTQVF